MPTLLTDPRSGGVKKNSGVVLSSSIRETWAEVRDDKNGDVDWVIIGYENGSKTDVTVTNKGSGGVESCCNALPEDEPVFGGIRLRKNGRFISFFYSGEGTSIIRKGRASMHKNGVLNTLEGCDYSVELKSGMTEDDLHSL